MGKDPRNGLAANEQQLKADEAGRVESSPGRREEDLVNAERNQAASAAGRLWSPPVVERIPIGEVTKSNIGTGGDLDLLSS